MSIGNRIREFGNSRFRTLKEFAEALDMKPPSLQSYLSGKREPGARILAKLYVLGCDVNWVISGKTKEERDQLKENDFDLVWKLLNDLGIKTKEDFDKLYKENEMMKTAKQIITVALAQTEPGKKKK